MPESNSDPDWYIAKINSDITNYDRRKPGILSRVGSGLLSPVNKLLGKMIPAAWVERALQAMDFVAENAVFHNKNADYEDLAACDRRANSEHNKSLAAAAALGAAAGFFGPVTLPADVIALVTQAIRLARQVGHEYGYGGESDPEKQEVEKYFILSVLRSASANTIDEKLAAQLAIAEMGQMLAKVGWKSVVATGPKGAFIVAVRTAAKAIGVNITNRVALAAVPVVGAAVGAAINTQYMHEVGVAAQMAFRKRWLWERDKREAGV